MAPLSQDMVSASRVSFGLGDSGPKPPFTGVFEPHLISLGLFFCGCFLPDGLPERQLVGRQFCFLRALNGGFLDFSPFPRSRCSDDSWIVINRASQLTLFSRRVTPSFEPPYLRFKERKFFPRSLRYFSPPHSAPGVRTTFLEITHDVL